MNSTTHLSKAIKSAILLGASSTALLATPTMANEVDSEEKIERIQVTGSRISRTDMETASPVTVISADSITKGGFTSVDEVLASQPSAAGVSLGASSNNGGGGSATVNLRGMGSQRTLVLLNGRRMVSSGTGADSSVDLNTIPVAMIKSIEILKDGASAVYGSDAIAGVVNIITKKDYEGTEISADLSGTDKGDGESGGFSILHGTEIAGGNLVAGFSYTQRGEVIQSDRDFTPPGGSSFIPGGSLGGLVPDESGNFNERTESYDFTTSSYAQTPNKLYSIFSAFNKEIASDTEFSIDAMYTFRDSEQKMAPQPANIDLETSQLDSQYVDAISSAYDAINNKQENLDNPDYKNKVVGDSLNYRRRMTDAGPRISEQETHTYRISAGLKGYLDNDDTWEMSATYGKNESKDTVQNSINEVNMITSIYANQEQWFSGEAIDRDLLVEQDVIYTQKNEGGNEQFTIAMGYSGLSESDIGYAFGIENRYESGYYTPDAVVQAGEGTSAQQDPTDGNYNVFSGFAEFSVPVTEELAMEAAVRYDNYSTFGNATTWKLGATYTVNENLMVRSVAATGFRAPSVAELYSGNSGSYDYLTDPWGNAVDPQILVNRTGSDDLQPEESESFTFGIVWDVNDSISTTIDYWKFDISDAITRLNVQSEMNACFEGDLQSCQNINIGANGEGVNGKEGSYELTSALTNVGTQETSGIDWNVTYSGDMFRVVLDTTYLIDFTEDDVDYTGTIDGNYGAYAEIKSTLTVTADITDDVSVQYIGQYLGGMDADYYGDAYSTDAVMYHNISSNYHINDMWSVNAGVQNLFDKEPETVLNGSDMDTVPEIYDTIGRTFYISTTYKL